MTPELLAPAGDASCFLAALAAGADAIYLGLKHFSARMQAENFSIGELARLTALAKGSGCRVHVAMNTLLKPADADSACRLVSRLERDVQPDALIVQDLAMLDIARQAGFSGELHLSTLANVTHPAGLRTARALGAHRVVLPRELSIDAMKMMGEACPEGLELECFIHGALCYCVSGRCYWSSYMGGKSGLRGRCVQPCRRIYRQGGREARVHLEDARASGALQERRRPVRRARSGKEHSGRYFSCLDLSLDVLVKTLLSVPRLTSWKIEGRKKGPHYVYHVVTAYRLLRDNPGDPQARKDAEDILGMALGRPATRAHFLPQRGRTPTAPDDTTSSGLQAGKIILTPEGKPALKARMELLPQDYLRIGVEDESWHSTLPVTRRLPKMGTLLLRLPKHKTPKVGTPVYLIDRREPELVQILQRQQQRLAGISAPAGRPVACTLRYPVPCPPRRRPDMHLRGSIPQGRETRAAVHGGMSLWLSPRSVREVSRTISPRITWWLPPVIWPEGEAEISRLIRSLLRAGVRHFVCNAPWQVAFFTDVAAVDLVAGPFCNAASPVTLGMLAEMGFAGAFVSPELAREDFLALPRKSPLPLGMVLDGFWPVGISHFSLTGVKADEPFRSPRGEVFWAHRYGPDIWIYPGWPLDLREQREQLEGAGYSFFAHIYETVPETLPEIRRQGLFNWEGALL